MMMPHMNGENPRNGSDDTGVPNSARSIFRMEARRQDQQARAEILLPRLVSPPAFALFWLLALLLTTTGALIAFWPILSSLVP